MLDWVPVRVSAPAPVKLLVVPPPMYIPSNEGSLAVPVTATDVPLSELAFSICTP